MNRKRIKRTAQGAARKNKEDNVMTQGGQYTTGSNTRPYAIISEKKT